MVQCDLGGPAVEMHAVGIAFSAVHGTASGTAGEHGNRPPDEIRPGALCLASFNNDADGNARKWLGVTHVMVSRWRMGRPVSKFCGLMRSSCPRHGKDKINRLAAKTVECDARVAQRSAGKRPTMPARSSASIAAALPQRIAYSGRLGVEPDIPGQRHIAWLD